MRCGGSGGHRSRDPSALVFAHFAYESHRHLSLTHDPHPYAQAPAPSPQSIPVMAASPRGKKEHPTMQDGNGLMIVGKIMMPGRVMAV